ncbi:MAG TPA: hypothetical protein VGD39_06205 [Nocardioides sp.]
MTDLDHAAALRLGGWDARYAVVLATAARDGVAAALVDTNGDGADVDLDQYEQNADGVWAEVASGNCGETGAFATGFMGVAWGRADPRTVVGVEFRGVRYFIETSDQGWWMFVAPSDSGDWPQVVGRDQTAG